MATKVLAASALTGGGVGALDNIPASYLAVGDMALVIALDPADGTTYLFYSYRFEASGQAESSPNVIKPDDEGEAEYVGPFGHGHADAEYERRADHADEVLGTDVRCDERSADDVPGQRAAGQEVAVGAGAFFFPR